MTDAERLLWRELRRAAFGWRFRRQFPIAPYIVDFACIEARLIVEIDGGQHSGSDADRSRDAALQRQGWRVLRFWNNEIIENRAGVLQRIAEILGPWPSLYPHPNPPPQAGEGVPAGRSAEAADDKVATASPAHRADSLPRLRGRDRVGA